MAASRTRGRTSLIGLLALLVLMAWIVWRSFQIGGVRCEVCITYGGGSDGNPLGSTTPWCQLYVDPSNFANPPKGAYPIVGFSYWLFYGQNNGIHVSDKQTLVTFITSAAANKLVSKLEYTPLSNSIHTAITNALNGTSTGSGSGHPCLQ